MFKYASQRFWENIASFKNYILRNTKYHATYSEYTEFTIGEIPTYQNGVLDYMKENSVTDIISIVADEEYLPNLIHTPIPVEDLKEYDINVWRVKLDDAMAPDISCANIICDMINRIITNNGIVYIHCRSGIGRSPLVGAMVIMKRYGWDIDKSIEYVKKYRPEVHFSKIQLKFLEKLRIKKEIIAEYNYSHFLQIPLKF
jgi:protein-tyrosine phosphatase